MRKSGAFTLIEVVVGIGVLFIALTPLLLNFLSPKNFSLVTLKEIQAVYFGDEIITQLFVYPKNELVPAMAGAYSGRVLDSPNAAPNDSYIVKPFGKDRPGLYLTKMPAGFERKLDISYDDTLNYYKIKVIVSYDTYSLTGKPKISEVSSGGIISSME